MSTAACRTPRLTQSTVFTNFGSERAMRAPNHPQSCLLTEAAVDDLAEKLGMDPLEFRLKNLGPRLADHADLRGRDRDGGRADRLATEAEAARQDGHRRRSSGHGHGPAHLGRRCAAGQAGLLHDQPGRLGRAQDRPPRTSAPVPGRSWRSSPPRSSGLQPTDIISNIGNSTFPPGQPSGGSTTTPSMAPPCYDAVTKARDALVQEDRPAFNNAKPEDLSLKEGQVWVVGRAGELLEGRLPQARRPPISETGNFVDGLSSVGVGGCQFAEVVVDIETGMVKVKKIVAIQDTGLILDKLTWESQVYGGVIMGLNYGLFEERIVDPTTGRMLNPDMEWYKLAGRRGHPRDHRPGLRARRAEGPRRHRRRRAADDLHRRGDRQRGGRTPSASGSPNGRCPPATCSTPWPRPPEKGERNLMKAFEYAAPATVDGSGQAPRRPQCGRPSAGAPTCSAG